MIKTCIIGMKTGITTGIALAVLTVLSAPATASKCPTLEALADGFQLVATDGEVSNHELVNGRMLTQTLRGSRVVKSVYVDIQPESFDCPSGDLMTYEWDADPSGRPDLVIGQTRTDRALVTECNGKVRAGEFAFTLAGPSSVTIGACTYPTQRIEKITRMDGVVVNEGWFDYQPDLRWILKSRFRYPGKPDREFGFKSISPR
jgi:hypothetical protein